MKFAGIVLHASFVHFPIALFCFEFFLMLLWRLRGNAEYKSAARMAFLGAYVMLFGAVASGYFDAGGEIKDLFVGGVKPHFFSVLVLFAISTGRLILTRLRRESPDRGWAELLGPALTVAAVAVTAYWGGELVYP